MKDELVGKIILTFVGLRAETYGYLTVVKIKRKRHQKCVIKRKFKFEKYETV